MIRFFYEIDIVVVTKMSENSVNGQLKKHVILQNLMIKWLLKKLSSWWRSIKSTKLANKVHNNRQTII